MLAAALDAETTPAPGTPTDLPAVRIIYFALVGAVLIYGELIQMVLPPGGAKSPARWGKCSGRGVADRGGSAVRTLPPGSRSDSGSRAQPLCAQLCPFGSPGHLRPGAALPGRQPRGGFRLGFRVSRGTFPLLPAQGLDPRPHSEPKLCRGCHSLSRLVWQNSNSRRQWLGLLTFCIQMD